MRAGATLLGRFLAAAAILLALWSFGGVGDAYGRLVIRVVEPAMHGLSGFYVESVRPKPGGLNITIVRGAQREVVPLQPREVFSGIIPFLALMAATAGLAWRRRLKAAATGVGILFVFHFGLMLLAPYLASPHVWWVNKIIDVCYGFYGLVGYAALPFVLWFWLARPEAFAD